MRLASTIGLALFAILLAVAAFAKGGHMPKVHYAVLNTVGNCSVIDAKPSPYDVCGLNVVGDKSGYSSIPAAENVIKSDVSRCKGTIERA
jgi:hypothetical protein